MPIIGLRALRGRDQSKSRIKTWGYLKSYIDVRLYQYLPLDEKLMKERPIVAKEEINLQEGEELILVFDEKRKKESVSIDVSSHNPLK